MGVGTILNRPAESRGGPGPVPRPGPVSRLGALGVGLVVALVAAACGGGSTGGTDRPVVVATTSILGDVVTQLVGDTAGVEVLLPPGADPHDLQLSASQAALLREAALVVTNGGGLEEAIGDALRSAERDGARLFVAMDHVPDPLPATGSDHDHGDDHGDDHDEGPGGSDGSGGGGDATGGGAVDPHFFGDPVRMAAVVEALADELAEVLGEPGSVRTAADRYVETLAELDREVADLIEGVPPGRRAVVTSHAVLGYFADRYGLRVVGTVVGATTLGEPDAGHLAELARLLADGEAAAVVVDASSPSPAATALARDAGVPVVELYTESLGPPGSGAESYVGMIRTNARRLAEALGGTP